MKALDALKAALATATPGEWVYEKERDTHDSCIHVNQPAGEYGYYGPMQGNGGVVGSSEWIWIRDEDARLITLMKACLPALIECAEASQTIANLSLPEDSGAYDDEDGPPSDDTKDDYFITYGQIRTARAALAKLENNDDTR